MNKYVICMILAGLMVLPVMACPDGGLRCPPGTHPVRVCEDKTVCQQCWVTGPWWHRVTHCLDRCPGGQSCYQSCDTVTSCHDTCVPDEKPEPEPEPVKDVGILPFSDPTWALYPYSACKNSEDTIGTLPVGNRIVDVNVLYGSELDGFEVRSLTRGEISCLERGYYNQACQGSRLYGSSSGGLTIRVIDPTTFLEVTAVKNPLETVLPMTVTITDGADGTVYYKNTVTGTVFHVKFSVPDVFPGCV